MGRADDDPQPQENTMHLTPYPIHLEARIPNHPTMLNEDHCWQAVLDRDRLEDGRFFFGVLTTGIFCRPSCPARKPLRKNVRFFETAEAAQSAGLRPCRRCKPLDGAEDRRVEQMRELCEFIREHSNSGDPLTLGVLSQRAGLSPSRLRRIFREIVGVTPRQFVEACRFETLKSGLRQGDDVTTSIYAAGFGSASRVYGRVDDRLGMTPGQYRAGGESLAISYVCGETPIGRVLLAATDRGLCSVEIGDDDEALLAALRREYPQAALEPREAGSSEQLDLWWQALARHLEGDEPHLDLPLDVKATAFQHKVWNYLQSIPFGETRSYSEVAEGIGQPKAVRAVASACAANRAALVVPCHRVIRADGEPGGYRWGAERKRRLLEREEQSALSQHSPDELRSKPEEWH